MFIPSALLGFVIGMTIWIINLIIIRLYSSARKGFKTKINKENPTVDFDLKLKMNAGGGEDLWKNIRLGILLDEGLLNETLPSFSLAMLRRLMLWMEP